MKNVYPNEQWNEYNKERLETEIESYYNNKSFKIPVDAIRTIKILH